MMDVTISSIADAGHDAKERLILKVLKDTDAGYFAVFRTRFEDNAMTNRVSRAFWFPMRPVKQGDLIVLYTKPGDEGEKMLRNGRTAYFFYWGRNEAQWSDASYRPVVVSTPEWDFVSPERE